MESSTILLRLLQILRPFRGVLALSTLCRLVNQALGIALIVVSVWALAQVARSGETTSVIPFALLLAGLGMLKGIFRYLEQFSGHFVAFRLLQTLRHQLYEKLEALAPSGLAGQRSGDFVARAVSDIERIEVFYAHTIAPVVVAAVLPVAVLSLLWNYSSAMALALLPSLLLVGGVIPILTQQFTRPAAREARAQTAALTSSFTDSLQGVREILVFGCEARQEREVREMNQSLAAAQKRLSLAGAWQSGLSDFFIGTGILAVLLAGAFQVQRGQLSGWDYPTALALGLCAFLPLLGISNLIPDLDQALGSAERIFELLDRKEPYAAGEGKRTPPRSAHLRFEAVSFAYPGETEAVLRGLSFEAQAGQITAIVGESGAGKSTIVHLLLGFWPIQDGCIRMGGSDARSFTPEALRDFYAVAPQRAHLFNQSLRENLLLARPGATQPEIEAAGRLAGIHDFISSLPQGYDTPAHEAGKRLSGGQRQRLTLARAFLKDAPVLVLDEATSSLDVETEAGILENLRAWIEAAPGHQERAVILVTHRLAGARLADHVVVLQNGLAGEQGSHEELMAAAGSYAALFSAQTHGGLSGN